MEEPSPIVETPAEAPKEKKKLTRAQLRKLKLMNSKERMKLITNSNDTYESEQLTLSETQNRFSLDEDLSTHSIPESNFSKSHAQTEDLDQVKAYISENPLISQNEFKAELPGPNLLNRLVTFFLGALVALTFSMIKTPFEIYISHWFIYIGMTYLVIWKKRIPLSVGFLTQKIALYIFGYVIMSRISSTI